MVAGQCSCKANVQGLQCSECKTGYFNLTSDTPQGCQECSCNNTGMLYTCTQSYLPVLLLTGDVIQVVLVTVVILTLDNATVRQM